MDVTQRFSDRVDDYDRYRPRYPAALATWLAVRGVGPGTAVADVGAGTGILAELLLGLGCAVHLVDPNAPMLDRARERLAAEPRATFHGGRAESTGLETASVDWVTAGQSFHWFDPGPTRRELQRILRPGGWVLLVWNDQRREPGFMADYEALVSVWARDYKETSFRMRPVEQDLISFFGRPPERATFDNHQVLDQDGLVGRYFSSSYMPGRSDPTHAAARRAALELFARHQQNGVVTMRYDTRVFLGRLG
jgi:ubiquinone/menaquinone biosynthesis C-methylase UbiE